MRNTNDNRHKHDRIASKRGVRPTFWNIRYASYEHKFSCRFISHILQYCYIRKALLLQFATYFGDGVTQEASEIEAVLLLLFFFFEFV